MDSLLQAIVDAPDDDEPRLVWADREGGERGELVVLQCQIAARMGTRADRVKMQARVRELLPRFQGEGETCVRGFVECARVDLDALTPELFARLPLLRDVRVAKFTPYIRPAAYEEMTLEEAWAAGAERLTTAFSRIPAGRIRKLEASAEIVERGDYAYPHEEHQCGDAFVRWLVGMPALATSLTELTVIAGGLTDAAIPYLERIPYLTSLHGGARLGAVRCIELLRANRLLRRFGPWHSSPNLGGEELATLLSAPEVRRLRELDLWGNDLTDEDLERLAGAPFAKLEILGVGMGGVTTRGLAQLAFAPHLFASLVELDVYAYSAKPSPAPLCRAPFALQRLRLSAVDDAIVDALVQAPALEKVRVDTISPDQLERLRATIPFVNDGGW